MPSLQYSKQALDALKQFHRSRYVVYVEGDEDVPFWQRIFADAGVRDVYFKVAGGREEIEKYTQSVVVDGADIGVARDRDLNAFLGTLVDHPRVLYTHGYAIENSLCSVHAIEAVVRTLVYTSDDQTASVEAWFEAFERDVRQLVELDVADALRGQRIGVPLDNAFRYLDRKRRCIVVTATVAGVAEPIARDVGRASLRRARDLLRETGKRTRHHMRGHFLFSAVVHFVTYRVHVDIGRRPSISNHALYGMLIAHLSNGLAASGEMEYYRALVERFVAAA